MDSITTYTYGFGIPEELADENTEERGLVSDVDMLLERMNGGSEAVIIPRFIGVYQDRKMKADNQLDRSLLDEGSFSNRVMQGKQIEESFANQLLDSLIGEKDRMNPRLIHLLYDPNFGADITRMSFTDLVGRIAISPTSKIPDFYEKNVTIPYEINSAIIRLLSIGKTKEEILKELTPSIALLQEDCRTYGLTRVEYAFLKFVTKPLTQGRIIASPEDLTRNLFDSLMKKFLD